MDTQQQKQQLRAPCSFRRQPSGGASMLPAAGGCTAGRAGANGDDTRVVQCCMYLPGSRRASRTQSQRALPVAQRQLQVGAGTGDALQQPSAATPAGAAAAVLAPDGATGLPTHSFAGAAADGAVAVRVTALSTAVQAHELLAAQRARVALLAQQLSEKEALLDKARQLVRRVRAWHCRVLPQAGRCWGGWLAHAMRALHSVTTAVACAAATSITP
jgi:hypothetical protein